MGSRTILNIIESIEPGIVILNNDFSVAHINRVIFLMFGNLPKERLFESDIFGFHREGVRDKVLEMLRRASESKRQIPLSLKTISNEGQECYLLIKLVSLIDREMIDEKICALFYDITPFITLERKLIRVPVTSGGEIHLFKHEEIVYLKADNIYTRVYTESGEYHCDLSIGTLEKRLPAEVFSRIHRSYIVNMTRVRKVHRDSSECSVTIGDKDTRLPISRDKLQEFLVEIGMK